MTILEKIIDFIFGYDYMHEIIEWDIDHSYDCDVSFEEVMRRYHEEEEKEKKENNIEQ